MSRHSEYQSYLRSGAWKANRVFALARTGGLCQFCGADADHVHHVAYPKTIGDEEIDSLIPVCRRCHNISHGVQMGAVQKFEPMRETMPGGLKINYFVFNGRVYAPIEQWARALAIPRFMRVSFEEKIKYQTMLLSKRPAYIGNPLVEEDYGTQLYRWRPVDEAISKFAHEYGSHQYKDSPKYNREQKEELALFHERYQESRDFLCDLAEKHWAARADAVPYSEQGQAFDLKQLFEGFSKAIGQAIGPRLHEHDDRLNVHDIQIDEIRNAVPALRSADVFITVQRAAIETGFDPYSLPLAPTSRENLAQLCGKLLAKSGAEQGIDEHVRLPDSKIVTAVKTFRRSAIYSMLDEIMNKRQPRLM